MPISNKKTVASLPNGFQEELSRRLGAIDLNSTRSNKFDEFIKWAAGELEFGQDRLVCKFAPNSKNLRNRIRESFRKKPECLVLIIKSELREETLDALNETCASSPSLRVLVVVRASPEDNIVSVEGVLCRPGVEVPRVFVRDGAEAEILPLLDYDTGCEFTESPNSGECDLEELRDAVLSVGTRHMDVESQDVAVGLLSEAIGIPRQKIVIKHVTESKNLGNRISEGLGLSPIILLVVCPDVLQARVVEEYSDLVDGRGDSVLVTLSQGEEAFLNVDGSSNRLSEIVFNFLCRVVSEEECATALLRGTEESDDDASFQEDPEDGWRGWSYERWNSELIYYCFFHNALKGPLERLPATPEELAEAVGIDRREARRVAAAFVGACKQELPKGKGFRRFCMDFRHFRPTSAGAWNSSSQEPPHFFGMLWLTALICYGYPDAQGGFHERYTKLIGSFLGGQAVCIPILWRKLSAWTIRKKRRGENIRVVILPPEDSFRKYIGPSYFLAFPHQQDRRWLARALVEAELVGMEPPIRPVVVALQKYEGRFSTAFGEDFANFQERFFLGSEDISKSAFWRAVRQSALNPVVGTSRVVSGRTTILAVFDDEEFTPLVGCRDTWNPPSGFQIESPEGWSIGDWQSYVVAEDGSYRKAIGAVFDGEPMLGPGPRTILKQGVLVFQEDYPHGYYLASGHEIAEADLALVRDDLVKAFTEQFGGESEPTWIEGWKLVQGCIVMPLSNPPRELEGVYSLHKSMSQPQLRLVGGIRLPDGYFALGGLLPSVKASEAVRVYVEAGGAYHEDCGWDYDQRLWILPEDLVELGNSKLKVLAEWGVGNDPNREVSYRRLKLREAVIDDRFKTSPKGYYFRESCRPAQSEYEGGDEVPLDIAGAESEGANDFLTLDPSCRWLGPGLGEMSLEPKPGFDWMAVGDKKHPEALFFVGDPENLVPPNEGKSPHKGDRRHWRCAFLNSAKCYTRGAGGDWEEICSEQHPMVKGSLQQYRRQLYTSENAPLVPETGLETIEHLRPDRYKASEPTMNLVDAIAALSVNRSGLRYREVQEMFAVITGKTDYRLQHELIRAWCEQGCFDQIRSQSYGNSVIVARRPRFIAYRRGPGLEASLVGLVTSTRWREIVDALNEGDSLRSSIVEPGCFWQPSMLRVSLSEKQLRRIVDKVGLDPTQWMRWEDAERVVPALDVTLERQGINEGVAPGGYRVERIWEWKSCQFRREPSSDCNGTQIEQMSRDGRSTIYVVRYDGEAKFWTYIRNWALLCGYQLAGVSPFLLNDGGWVTTTGRSPVHLPLTMGRICAIAGDGLPGPLLDSTENNIESYCYPFGKRLTDLVSLAIPDAWITK